MQIKKLKKYNNLFDNICVNMSCPFNEIIMDIKYEGVYVLPPILCIDGSTTLTQMIPSGSFRFRALNHENWTLFNPSCLALDPENSKREITEGSGPKVMFQGNACYVSNDFEIEKDWWQLYPKMLTNLAIDKDI